MKYYFIKTVLIPILVILVSSANAQLLPPGVALRVVIIRHGEKPASGGNLSCAGLNRALKLPAVLDTITGKPDYTYIPTISTGKKTSSVRMFQTVTPFAVAQNLTLNSKYAETDTKKAAAAVLKKRGIVLMVWEHSNIPPLASALGAPGKLSWSGSDFDSIWILDFKASKTSVKFLKLTVEQENIVPAAGCL